MNRRRANAEARAIKRRPPEWVENAFDALANEPEDAPEVLPAELDGPWPMPIPKRAASLPANGDPEK